MEVCKYDTIGANRDRILSIGFQSLTAIHTKTEDEQKETGNKLPYEFKIVLSISAELIFRSFQHIVRMQEKHSCVSTQEMYYNILKNIYQKIL